MERPLAECAAGAISPPVAVGRMLLAGFGAQAMLRALAAAPAHPALDTMRALVERRAASLDRLAGTLSAEIAAHDASGPGGIERIAGFFDRAVRHSPEASVALYCLGDPELMEAATGELAAWLQAQGLVPAAADVLDLGCGIGRVMAALAPRAGSLLGIDVSAGMVAEAGRRLGGIAHATVRQGDGLGLGPVAARSLDLVLAVDSFPYLIQAGTRVARRHLEDAARALRPGGAVAVFNWSYDGGPVAQSGQIHAWASQAGLRPRLVLARPLQIWDGTATVLVRP